MTKEQLEANLKECIRLLNVDGKNTKKEVKFLLQEIVEELEDENKRK